MTSLTKSRIRWADLPAPVRAAVEDILGDRVVAAESQHGGFSPGTADRVRTAGGGRAFVKAVSPAQNDRSPTLHRAEARIAAALPPAAPAPRLLGSHDDGDWIALVFSDVEGRHPVTPWDAGELAVVLSTLEAMAGVLTPAPAAVVATATEQLGYDFGGWRRLADDPPADLDPWAAARLPELCAAADRGLAALAGDTLCHVDIRADNLLIGPDGDVTVVDWPLACRGPAWLDSLLTLINVQVHGGHDPEALLAARSLTAGVDAADVTGVLAGFTGFFLDGARQPPPPGIPTVRAFQRLQGDALLPWLARRMD
ncbi:phosphotransferase family protein [Micromonospora chaiyaphumensis]|uniref:Phosphotransferase enzyme family protein n=1 Tax=Micromonospora chaiyaphumensis TaxID=307119 RepID=A0A1C4Z236_9ACTN|nr:phosphotransferase [Micromonospora chaiyaphumensis]SCF27045.1 Phosphotransferase enzyme family protein [Micromonospora chaiyaphumensis]